MAVQDCRPAKQQKKLTAELMWSRRGKKKNVQDSCTRCVFVHCLAFRILYILYRNTKHLHNPKQPCVQCASPDCSPPNPVSAPIYLEAGLLTVREVFLIDARHHAGAETSLRNAHCRSARSLRSSGQKTLQPKQLQFQCNLSISFQYVSILEKSYSSEPLACINYLP